MKAVVRRGIATDISTTIRDDSMQAPTGSCSIFRANKKMNKPSFYAQDRTLMEEHLIQFVVVCSDITEPFGRICVWWTLPISLNVPEHEMLMGEN